MDDYQNVHTFQTMTAFLPYIVYGPDSAGDMTEEEMKQVDDYIAHHAQGEPYTVIDDLDSIDAFSMCHITELMGTTIELTIVRHPNR